MRTRYFFRVERDDYHTILAELCYEENFKTGIKDATRQTFYIGNIEVQNYKPNGMITMTGIEEELDELLNKLTEVIPHIKEHESDTQPETITHGTKRNSEGFEIPDVYPNIFNQTDVRLIIQKFKRKITQFIVRKSNELYLSWDLQIFSNQIKDFVNEFKMFPRQLG